MEIQNSIHWLPVKAKCVCSFILVSVLLGTFGFAAMIYRVEAYTSIYIRADGSIEPATANINNVDNVTFVLTGKVAESIVIQRDNIVVDGAGYTVQGTGSGIGIDLSGRSNVTIKNMTIKAFTEGIGGSDTSNNSVIVGNNITNNEDGIAAFSLNGSIVGNYISANSRYGLLLASSSNNTVVENYISANTVNGVVISSSTNNSIVKNNILDNGEGVVISSSTNNSIIKNNITSNDDGIIGSGSYNFIMGNNISANVRYGLDLVFSLNNSIIGNRVKNNKNGIRLTSSSGNLISQNNFEGNSLPAYVEPSEFANSWDIGYPAGGNLWGDYDATDFFSGISQNETGSDGIGDTAYSVDPTNIDHYPLMGTFSDFDVAGYSVQTVCNSTISNFQHNDGIIQFNVAGENGSIGFCRVRIPTAFMNGTYRIFANDTLVPHVLLSASNNAFVYLYFIYDLPTQKISVLPDAPMLFILPFIFVVTVMAKWVSRKNTRNKQRKDADFSTSLYDSRDRWN